MMGRHFLACVVLVAALAPVAGADLTLSGGAPYGVPELPQAYCAVVQTTSHTSTQPARCDVSTQATGVQLIRVRLVGEGHALTYADQGMGVVTQWGPIQCSADATHGNVAPGVCSTALVVNPTGVTAPFHMILLVDGPGRAVATATLENVIINLA